MKINTIVSDLDDTMLDANGELSPKTLSVMRECVRRGIRVIPSSGRTRQSMAYYMNQLQTGQPYIGGNGTEIMDKDGEYIQRYMLDTETLREICAILEKEKLYHHIYDEDTFYFEKACPQSDAYHLSSRMKAVAVDRPLSEYVHKPTAKVLVVNTPQENARGLAVLKKRFGDTLSYSSSKPYYLEIMPANTSKGEALRYLMQHCRWDPEEVLVFGDGLNDVSMIQAVPHGVAMGNAAKPIQAAAWRVCAPNTEDGLACFVEEMVLQGKGADL